MRWSMPTMKMENRVGATMHPCLTPVSVSTMKGSDSERLTCHHVEALVFWYTCHSSIQSINSPIIFLHFSFSQSHFRVTCFFTSSGSSSICKIKPDCFSFRWQSISIYEGRHVGSRIHRKTWMSALILIWDNRFSAILAYITRGNPAINGTGAEQIAKEQ